MNWGGFAGGLAGGFMAGAKMGGMIKGFNQERELESERAKAKEDAIGMRQSAIDNVVNQSRMESIAANGIQPVPAEAVTRGATQPTDSIIQNPESATGATVTPIVQGGATPSDPAGVAAPGAADPTASGAKAIIQEPARPITPQTEVKPVAAQGLPFKIGGKEYANEKDARAAAEKQVKSEDHYKTAALAKRMERAYIDRGDIENAEKWSKWAETKKGKEAIRDWAKAYSAPDFDSMLREGGKYYTDHVVDGWDYKGHEIIRRQVKAPDGSEQMQEVGVITIAEQGTGKEQKIELDRNRLIQMGAQSNPATLFESAKAEAAKAKELAAKVAADNTKSNRELKEKVVLGDRKFEQDKQMEGVKQANTLEKLSIEKQLEAANASTKFKREVGAKVEALRSAGYSQEFINGVLPGIIGVGEFKKATAPEEARRLAHSDRMKADPMYSRKSEAEQQAILDRDMKLIYGGVKPSSTPATAAPTTPAAGGLPQQATPQKKGTPFYDTATGTIVYR